jgi:phosphoribosylaminoimidazole carboxylase (NCAIR synthetase)
MKGRIEAMKDVLTGILKDVDDGGYDGEGVQVQEEDSDEDDDEEEKERERMFPKLFYPCG